VPAFGDVRLQRDRNGSARDDFARRFAADDRPMHGRSESRSAPGGADATVNNRADTRACSCVLKIYTPVGAIPAMCTLSHVLRSTDYPELFPRIDATPTVFLRELVQRRSNCDVVDYRIRSAVHDASRVGKRTLSKLNVLTSFSWLPSVPFSLRLSSQKM